MILLTTESACATTLQKIPKPSSPCPQYNLSEPLILQLSARSHMPFYSDAQEVCDALINDNEQDKENCVKMYNIVFEYSDRDRCFINWIEKYDTIDIWEKED